MMRCWVKFAAVISTCLCMGCGMSDYEQQMDKHHTRFARMDEEDRILGAPLQSPISYDVKPPAYDWPVEFFFRAPKRISTTPVATEVWYDPALKMHRFKDTQTHSPPFCMFFVAGPIAPDGGKQTPGTYTRSQFHTAVKQNLGEYFNSLLGRLPNFQEKSVFPYPPVTTKWARSKLQYHKYEWIDPLQNDVTFYGFFQSRGDTQAAVIFQTPSDVNWSKEMDASLKSMHLGAEAEAAREEYRQLHPGG